ncbi:hypothetical protein ST12_08390 [Clostridium botulinum]|uniref:hypothetical protein n=1 Tax=Clostridium botulinum TaxID=1491 RepID=UPI000174E457|nr:hypothetical protein [Clostridium botulinum]ACD53594.1 hypothetical protein CLH_1741 [Clostridium botulinum E3 str. Alaska E43]AJF29704.1 hypothetical protein ST13_08390 [Clostridium botulinum]AJF32765.1 hypothetical protein ST12_08390 [Clostridium botulinum]MBY6949097.1 hypothetical protein [Clostridium botulinum]MBY7022783.1 hypothetical protein [Clostridium botulinum]
MKKILNYFLIACAFMTVQFFGDNIVSAKPVMENADTSICTADKSEKFPIPMLVKLDQISPNQVQISYDRDVDIKLATKSTNYWIQDIANAKPKGIATLGKNDKVNDKNSLTDSMVKIQSKDGSAKTFILTLDKNIPKGTEYKLIICYVTVEGAPAYSGDNGMSTFVGK